MPVLPVPPYVTATYVVPSPRRLKDPQALVVKQAQARLAELAQQCAATMLRLDRPRPLPPVAVFDHTDLPPLSLLRAHGASPGDIDQLAGAAELIGITTVGAASVPYHELAARGAAVALAEHLGAPVLDLAMLRLRQPSVFRPTIAAGVGPWQLEGWLSAPTSLGMDGGLVTSLGLARYGLPELETTGIPPNLVGPWAEITGAAAYAVFVHWVTGLNGVSPLPDSLAVPEEIGVGLAALHASRGEPADGREVVSMVRLVPRVDEHGRTWLGLQPPRGALGLPGEWMARTVAAMFGEPGDRVILASRDAVLEAAIAEARAGLPDLRRRLLGAELPLGAVVMVKHGMRVQGAAANVWTCITDWGDPTRIVGTADKDVPGAEPPVRRGSPVAVELADVQDWVIQTMAEGIVEGYVTRAAAERGTPEQPWGAG